MDAEDLKHFLTSADRVIGYSPMGDEPDPGQFFREENVVVRGMSLLPTRDVPPEAVARPLVERYAGERICILIPGRSFDRFGTRHGRGGGWYDRFLSLVPRHWTRIGVARDAELSEEPLVRKEWDEPMDYILVKGDRWRIIDVHAA